MLVIKHRKYNFLLKTVGLYSIGVLLCCIFAQFAYAQENIVTVGLQFKPIIPIKYFFTEGTNITLDNTQFQIEQKFGSSWGMVVRKGVTKRLSFETGISYINRSYSLSIKDSINLVDNQFHVVAYEIPLNGLVYIRLTDKLYMNAALGVSVDLFPSDILTEDNQYQHYSQRKSWILPGVSANIGYEYRTEKIGYFYLGASYHRPFYNMYNTVIEYSPVNGNFQRAESYLAGNYLTVDFRYFFHETPLKKKLKSKKKAEEKDKKAE